MLMHNPPKPRRQGLACLNFTYTAVESGTSTLTSPQHAEWQMGWTYLHLGICEGSQEHTLH